MILQVGADAAQFMHHRHADRLQVVRRPDAGDLQQMRRVDRAAAQDDLLVGTRLDRLAALAERDADAALAFEQQFGGQRLGFDPQVRPALGLLQEGLRG